MKTYPQINGEQCNEEQGNQGKEGRFPGWTTGQGNQMIPGGERHYTEAKAEKPLRIEKQTSERLYIETQAGQRTLIYIPDKSAVLDEGLIELLRTQMIPGLLTLDRVQRGSEALLGYRLSGGESLEQILDGRISTKQLAAVMVGLAGLWLDLERYLAEPRQLVLDEQFLFLDEEGLSAVYLPLSAAEQSRWLTYIERTRENVLGDWLLYILPRIRLAEDGAAPLLMALFQYAHGREAVSAPGLLEVIHRTDAGSGRLKNGNTYSLREHGQLSEADRRRMERAEELRQRCREYFLPQQEKTVEKSEEKTVKPSLLQRWKQRWQAIWQQWVLDRSGKNKKSSAKHSRIKNGRIVGKEGRIGEDRLAGIDPEDRVMKERDGFSRLAQLAAGSSHETELLHRTELIGSGAVRLVRARTHECILLERFPCRLGKGRHGVDYRIIGNEAISRCHIEIRRSGDGYEAVDLASTNHSYINGTQLTAHRAQALREEDVLRLANEDFFFRQ